MNRIKPPLVSVVMGAYNAADHVRASVESILAQSFADFEFIIVNDGSTDGTRAILREYADRDARVRVIDQVKQGLTMALIHGCNAATGRFIARQDADDVSFPERLEKQVAMIESDSRLAFVSSWAFAMGPKDELLCEFRKPGDADEATRQLMYRRVGPPAHGTVMFRRAAYQRVGGYRKDFYYAQDSDLWLRLGEVGMLGYVPEFLYAYRCEADSISASRRQLQREFGRIGQACRAARATGEDESAWLAEAAKLAKRATSPNGRDTLGVHFIAACLRDRRDPRASSYFWESIRRRPLHAKSWIGLIRSRMRSSLKERKNVTSRGIACVDDAAVRSVAK